MKIDLIFERLHNQKLVRRRTEKPPGDDLAEVVSWLGAVQAQDYSGAKWALGQRTLGVTDADVENALNRGEIIRTRSRRRPVTNGSLLVEIGPDTQPSPPDLRSILRAAEGLGKFMGLPVDAHVRMGV